MMTKSARISYGFIFLVLVLVAWLHLATPLLTVLFSYFALSKLHFARRKWIAITLFTLLVVGVFYGFVYFIREAIVALPRVAEKSIPSIVEFLERQNFVDVTITEASPFLNATDIKTPVSLIAKISQRSDGVSKYLFDRLSHDAPGLFFGSRPSSQEVADALNNIIRGPPDSLYEASKTTGVSPFTPALSRDAKNLLATQPAGQELLRLNRMLLEDAYPSEIGKSLTDWQRFKTEAKTLVTENLKGQLAYLANFAKLATKQSAFLIIGLVVAVSLFINPKFEPDRARNPIPANFYSNTCDEISSRFGTFYRSFATVVGAQITISTINTALTAIFIMAVPAFYGYAPVVIGVTFLCGLLPIIGNLISNSVIVGIAFTISPKLALGALAFLVVLHKLEYFLNSKIIGDRIKNPVWLTLLGLILGDMLMGIPGMILAPVILNYVKLEASRLEVETAKNEAAAVSAPANQTSGDGPNRTNPQ